MKSIEIYFNLPDTNISIDMYTAGTTTKIASGITLLNSPKSGYFSGYIGNISGLYDVVETRGYGIDQVYVNPEDGHYACFGHSNSFFINLPEKIWQNTTRTLTSTSVSGDYLITINTTPNAIVQIRNADNTQDLSFGHANTLGEYKLMLSAGTYSLNISKFGYTSILDQNMVVSADSTINASLTEWGISTPSLPELCLLNVYCYLNGPVQDCLVTAELVEKNSTIDNYIVSQTIVRDITDSDGLATLQLIKASSFTSGTGTYKILAQDKNGKVFHERNIIIPDSNTINLEDI